MRCAQRGCTLPPDTTTTDGAVCPVCNNPLIVVMEDGDAEVSQEKPPFVPVGEDGPLLAVAVDGEREPPFEGDAPAGHDNGVNWATGN